MSDSPDRFRMCRACPNRHQADLADAVGEGDLAKRIRAEGCVNWQEGIPSVDPQLGFVASPTWSGCFVPMLPTWLIALARDATHSAAAFNDARDRVLDLARGGSGESRALHELALVGLSVVAGSARGDGRTIDHIPAHTRKEDGTVDPDPCAGLDPIGGDRVD